MISPPPPGTQGCASSPGGDGSMFGDDVLPFDVVEVPVPRRNGFDTETKKSKSFNFGTKPNRGHCRRRFCREFEPLSRDAPSSKLMIFVQHLYSTGYSAHCATHTRSVQRSPCPRLTSMPYASQSPQVPKNLTATAHRSWDSLTLFNLSLSVYSQGYYVREKLQLSNHNAHMLMG